MTKIILNNSWESTSNNNWGSSVVETLMWDNIKPRYIAIFKTLEEEELALKRHTDYIANHTELVIPSETYLKSRDDFYARNRTITSDLLKHTYFLFNNILDDRYIYVLDNDSNLSRYKDNEECCAVFSHELLGPQHFLDDKEKEWLQELILNFTSRI